MGCTLRNTMETVHVGEICEGESVQNYSVQYNGYNLIGVTTVERGDGSHDNTSLFLNIRQLL